MIFKITELLTFSFKSTENFITFTLLIVEKMEKMNKKNLSHFEYDCM